MGLPKDKEERSIYQAYLNLINEAERFIYIENQFFISSNSGDIVSNEIAITLVDKIKEKILANQEFMVVLFLPLLPGMDGNIEDKSASHLRVILGYEHRTIDKGPNSILGQISQYTKTPEKYFRVYGLRNHGVMPNGNPATEMVYIHSKLMIIDDKKAILGTFFFSNLIRECKHK